MDYSHPSAVSVDILIFLFYKNYKKRFACGLAEMPAKKVIGLMTSFDHFEVYGSKLETFVLIHFHY